MIASAKQETQVLPLAAVCLSAESSRLGHPLPKTAMHQAWTSVSSTSQQACDFWYDETASVRLVGLDYFNARYYSTAQGRFQSSDPGNAGADATTPETWNGYGYVANSPLTLTDPSGEFLDAIGIGAETGNPIAIGIGAAIDLGELFFGLFGFGGGGAPPQPTWTVSDYGASSVQTAPPYSNPEPNGAPGSDAFQAGGPASQPNDSDLFYGFGWSLVPRIFWPKFKSLDCAGYQAASSIIPVTNRTSLEHGGYIYKMGDRYTISPPISGGPTSLPGLYKIPTPIGMEQAGYYHTHPNIRGHNANVFSGEDAWITAHLNGFDGKGPAYLGTPGGTVLKLTPPPHVATTYVTRGACKGN